MAEFGDLSSFVHGFLFTVTNKLPNKSLPDLKKIKIIKKRKEKKRKKKEKKKTPQNCKSPMYRQRFIATIKVWLNIHIYIYTHTQNKNSLTKIKYNRLTW